MQELAPNSEHSSLSGTAVKQSSEGSRNLVCTLATIRQGAMAAPSPGGGSAGSAQHKTRVRRGEAPAPALDCRPNTTLTV